MKTRIQTDTWIYRTVIVLGSTLAATVAGSFALLLMGQPTSELLIALGSVAGAGLVKLLISPLNRGLFE